MPKKTVNEKVKETSLGETEIVAMIDDFKHNGISVLKKLNERRYFKTIERG
jgi:hypothetical protein